MRRIFLVVGSLFYLLTGVPVVYFAMEMHNPWYSTLVVVLGLGACCAHITVFMFVYRALAREATEQERAALLARHEQSKAATPLRETVSGMARDSKA